MIRLFTLILGSKLFGTAVEDSDTDFFVVNFNPEGIFDESLRKTVHTHIGSSSEKTSMELSKYMGLIRSKDLKVLESLAVDFPEALRLYNPKFRGVLEELEDYAQSLDLKDMLLKDVQRRYSKAWYKEINPTNYKQGKGYDSKYASHLLRVIWQADNYAQTGQLHTRGFGEEYRNLYLDIKQGRIPKEQVFTVTTEAIKYLKTLEFPTKKEKPFPTHVYYDVYNLIGAKK